jgi:hypothetical protein
MNDYFIGINITFKWFIPQTKRGLRGSLVFFFFFFEQIACAIINTEKALRLTI